MYIQPIRTSKRSKEHLSSLHPVYMGKHDKICSRISRVSPSSSPLLKYSRSSTRVVVFLSTKPGGIIASSITRSNLIGVKRTFTFISYIYHTLFSLQSFTVVLFPEKTAFKINPLHIKLHAISFWASQHYKHTPRLGFVFYFSLSHLFIFHFWYCLISAP